jgi:hypothetical protein
MGVYYYFVLPFLNSANFFFNFKGHILIVILFYFWNIQQKLLFSIHLFNSKKKQ